MKQVYSRPILMLMAMALLSFSLSAQETKVTIKVERDGEVVKDTTYTYDDSHEADHAVEMIELLSGDDEQTVKIHKEIKKHHDGHHSSYVYIMEDGEKKEIKHMHGDSLVWIHEEGHDGEHVKVMKYHVEVGDEPHGEHVVVMKSGEGDDKWEIITRDGEDEDVEVIVVKKKVKKHKEGELHEEHELHEQQIEVEVEVEKETKKKKKSKKQ